MPSGAASVVSASPYEGGVGPAQAGAGRRRGVPVKTLKRALKKAGLKVSGKKATLTRRAKKAHLKLRGGGPCETDPRTGEKVDPDCVDGGRRRRKSRKNGLVQGVYRGTTGLAKGTLRTVGRFGRSVFGRGGCDPKTGVGCE